MHSKISNLLTLVLSARPINTNRVVFEGGLGNQLLALFRLRAMERMGKSPQVSFSYFLSTKSSRFLFQANRRKWALDELGETIDSLQAEFPDSTISSLTRLLSRAPRFMDLSNELKNFNWLDHKYIQGLGLSFPEPVNLRNRLGLARSEKYSVLHVRQGDYLELGIQLLDSSYYQEGLEFLKSQVSGKLYIFSDSILNESFRQTLMRSSAIQAFTDVFFLDGLQASPSELHAFMSGANAIICGDSTYSFTSGLMSRSGTLVLFPPQVLGGISDLYSNFITVSSKVLVVPT